MHTETRAGIKIREKKSRTNVKLGSIASLILLLALALTACSSSAAPDEDQVVDVTEEHTHEEEADSHEEEEHTHEQEAQTHEEETHSHEEEADSHEEEEHSHEQVAQTHEEEVHSHEEEAHSHEEEAHSHAGAEAHGIPEEAAAVPNPIAASAESVALGAEVFATNCVACHGETGRGDGPSAAELDPKPANLSEHHVQDLSDGGLFYIIQNGVTETAMPAWKDVLGEEDIWHVVNFLRTFDRE